MTEPLGSERLSNGWRETNLSPPTGTRGSGSPWIPCAISASWRRFGTRAMRPGSAGDERGANGGTRAVLVSMGESSHDMKHNDSLDLLRLRVSSGRSQKSNEHR